jgi:hypothetical protein
MKLTKEQSNKLFEKMSKFSEQFVCPICHYEPLNLNDTIFELREFQGGDLVVGGMQSVFPVIPITCPQCGYTMFINAMISNLIEGTVGEK